MKGQLFNETNKSRKDNLRDRISNKIRKLLDSAEQFAGYKIDFDIKLFFSEVFHEKKGFDVVIGNPPYIQLQKDGGKLASLYSEKGYETFKRTGDIYALFYEKGIKLLRLEGCLTFITSNKWIRASYGEPLRNFLTKNTLITDIVDFGELPVFKEAATFPAIILIKKTRVKSNTRYSQIKDLKFDNLYAIVTETSVMLSSNTFTENSWSLSDDKTAKIIEKMKNVSNLLGDYVDNNIKYGLKTGFNNAFVINESKRKELISLNNKCSAFIKPLINGDDIRKYEFRRNKRYVIVFQCGWTNENRGNKNGETFFKESFRPIYDHMKKIGNSFEGKGKGLYDRDDMGNYWWELRPCKYYQLFGQPKIHVPAFALEPRFAYDDEGFYSFAPAYVLPGDKYLLAILNSKAGWFALKKLTPVLGDENKRGRLIIRTIYFSQLPIPNCNPQNKQKIISLVDKIHNHKSEGKNSSRLEAELDLKIYHLYTLAYEEAKIIDPELSEEEFEKYKTVN